MKLHDLRIRIRLGVGFAIVLVLAAISAGIGVWGARGGVGTPAPVDRTGGPGASGARPATVQAPAKVSLVADSRLVVGDEQWEACQGAGVASG